MHIENARRIGRDLFRAVMAERGAIADVVVDAEDAGWKCADELRKLMRR
jgi:hypothetical protein